MNEENQGDYEGRVNFFRSNKHDLIISLFNGAIKLKIYELAYEISHYFMDELLMVDYLPCFD